jgi:hypothetical protein
MECTNRVQTVMQQCITFLLLSAPNQAWKKKSVRRNYAFEIVWHITNASFFIVGKK